MQAVRLFPPFMVCRHGMFKERLYAITVRAVRKACTVYHQTSSAVPCPETAYTPTDVTEHSSRASVCSIPRPSIRSLFWKVTDRFFGAIRKPKCSSTGFVKVDFVTEKFRNNMAIADFISNSVRLRPGHDRGPAPKGTNALGLCRCS